MIKKGTFTSIGSWPFTDADKITGLILDNFRDLPAWPQLVKTGYRENMYVQYSEGLPCIKIDEAGEKIYFDTSGDIFNEIQVVYENFLGGNFDHFAVTEKYAAGLYKFRDMAKSRGRLSYVKGQILGPISLGLTLTDENKKLIFYNEQMADAIVKTCVCKAVWQVNFLREIADNIVLFIDEPYLVSFGSAYVNLTREQVVSILNEITDKMHEMGVLTGIHCCGNTDWSILMDTNIDMINFDAYDYAEGLLLYPDRIKKFLSGENKYLAWGIVPTAENKIAVETGESLYRKLSGYQERLSALGVDGSLVADRTVISPSCGTGSISEEASVRVIELLKETSGLFRKS